MQNSRTVHNNLISSTAPRAYRDAVWKGSRRSEKKFTPIARRQARAVWRHAKRLESRTRGNGPFGPVNGVISRIGLSVLNALLFDFHDYRSGRCDPEIGRASCRERV